MRCHYLLRERMLASGIQLGKSNHWKRFRSYFNWMIQKGSSAYGAHLSRVHPHDYERSARLAISEPPC